MSLFHTHLLLPLAEPERHAGLARRMREIRRFEAAVAYSAAASAATTSGTHSATCLRYRAALSQAI